MTQTSPSTDAALLLPKSGKKAKGLLEEYVKSRQKIIDLEEAEIKELEESLRYLETCGTACDDDHGVDACPKCNVGDSERAASSPALVAGFYKG